MSHIYENIMKYALGLAAKGAGSVSPNPMVGAVVVRSGEVIAEGWHRAHGEAHAEVEALADIEKKNIHICHEDVMFVTLEPCNHYGKTPPCTEAIIKSGIRNVVVAMEDPNPLVSGQGIKRMREDGINVQVGTLEKEARELNKSFIKNITTGLPYCTVKWAMTLDGKMATDSGDSQWISCEASRKLVHVWRRECDAVLIGSGTAESDDPQLNVRMVDGDDPFRVVIDSKGQLGLNSNLVCNANPSKTILLTTAKADVAHLNSLELAGIQVVVLAEKDNHVDLKCAFEHLAQRKLINIFSESGPKLQGALITEGLVDQVKSFISPKIVGGHINAPFASLKNESMEQATALSNVQLKLVGEDVLIEADIGRVTCLQD